MGRFRIVLHGAGAVLLSCVLEAPALARDYYYFNKPEVSRDHYAADVTECAELAGGARAPQRGPVYTAVPNNQYSIYAVPIAMLFAGLMARGEQRRLKQSVERTCMADKGYARMKVDKALIAEIDALPDEKTRLDRMFDLAASPQPIGKRVPE